MISSESGPLYCWPTFGFEDINCQLLKMIHGTGDVTSQLFCMKEIRNTINCLDHGNLPNAQLSQYIQSLLAKSRSWKVLEVANNCKVFGPTRDLPKDLPQDIVIKMLRVTGVESNKTDFKMVQRVVINDNKFI